MIQSEYRQTGRYFAQIAQGFEEPATRELTDLGAFDILNGFRGLYFSADQAALYRINYQARLLTRVLAPLDTFRCRDRDDLYRWAKSRDWHTIFNVDQTFAIFANVNGNPNLTHSKFAALCLKDGIVDAFRDRFNQRPNVNSDEPDVWLNLFIEKDKAVVSLDTSGGSLHRRGYRRYTIAAPMQETLAAAIIVLTGWQGERPLVDPMCGSGTLLCEALMRLCRIPAGYLRHNFGFRFLPDFNPDLWTRIKEEADNGIRPLAPGLVSGSDIDSQAVAAAAANCSLLPGGQGVAVHTCDYQTLSPLENTTIICNPPYGIRMGQDTRLDLFYKQLGDFLKQQCKGSHAYIYFGNRELIKKFGLKPTWKKPLRNGGLDGRLVKYELY